MREGRVFQKVQEMAIEGIDPVGGVTWALVRMSLNDWEPQDLRRYVELA